MNPRERLLTAVVGSLMGLIVLYFGFTSVWGWFEDRNTRLENFRRDLKLKKEELVKAHIAAQRLVNYEARSLPRELDVAQSAYQSWLLEITQAAALQDVNITSLKPRANQRTYHALGYTLSAQGTLPQLAQWLYRYEAEDRLQRIETLSLKPLKDSKTLLMTLSLSALAVNAAKVEKFEPRPKANWPTLASFTDPILNRNFFAPPNQPPKFDSASPPTAYIGRSWEWSPKVSDGDPLDKFAYSLVGEAPAGFKLDATNGKCSWSPSAKGEFTFTLAARDDGLPSSQITKEIILLVTDPPPPPPPPVEAPKKLAFDHAKYTFLTAVIEVNGQPEVWLHIRPLGEIRKLREGDKFEIGSITGRIETIQSDDVIYECEGKLRKLVRGELLYDAPIIVPELIEN